MHSRKIQLSLALLRTIAISIGRIFFFFYSHTRVHTCTHTHIHKRARREIFGKFFDYAFSRCVALFHIFLQVECCSNIVEHKVYRCYARTDLGLEILKRIGYCKENEDVRTGNIRVVMYDSRTIKRKQRAKSNT